MHRNFRDINDRLWIMGDYAENEFKAFCNRYGITALPFGFNRPPFQYFPQMPHTLRAMPDYLCETSHLRMQGLLPPIEIGKTTAPRHFFCEVKGCGKDGIFKLKDETIDALGQWQQMFQRPVMFFLFDQPNQKICFSLSLENLKTLINANALERGKFVDRGKERPFYKLKTTSHPALQWEPACAPAG